MNTRSNRQWLRAHRTVSRTSHATESAHVAFRGRRHTNTRSTTQTSAATDAAVPAENSVTNLGRSSAGGREGNVVARGVANINGSGVKCAAQQRLPAQAY